MSAQVFTLLFGLPFLWVFYQSRPGAPSGLSSKFSLQPLLALACGKLRWPRRHGL